MHLYYPYVLVDVLFKYMTDMRFPRSTLSEFSQYERLGPSPSTPYVCSDAIPLGESLLHETCKYIIFVLRCY
jgi:hypothetical protein